MYTHNSHSKIFKTLCISSIIIVLIGGIICGFVFKMSDFDFISDIYSYSHHALKDKFNWALMLGIWVSGIFPAIGLYAIHAHLQNQEIQINILNAIKENKEITPGTTTIPSSDFKSLDREHNNLRCSNCNTLNPIGTEICKKCAVIL